MFFNIYKLFINFFFLKYNFMSILFIKYISCFSGCISNLFFQNLPFFSTTFLSSFFLFRRSSSWFFFQSRFFLNRFLIGFSFACFFPIVVFQVFFTITFFSYRVFCNFFLLIVVFHTFPESFISFLKKFKHLCASCFRAFFVFPQHFFAFLESYLFFFFQLSVFNFFSNFSHLFFFQQNKIVVQTSHFKKNYLIEFLIVFFLLF